MSNPYAYDYPYVYGGMLYAPYPFIANQTAQNVSSVNSIPSYSTAVSSSPTPSTTTVSSLSKNVTPSVTAPLPSYVPQTPSLSLYYNLPQNVAASSAVSYAQPLAYSQQMQNRMSNASSSESTYGGNHLPPPVAFPKSSQNQSQQKYDNYNSTPKPVLNDMQNASSAPVYPPQPSVTIAETQKSNSNASFSQSQLQSYRYLANFIDYNNISHNNTSGALLSDKPSLLPTPLGLSMFPLNDQMHDQKARENAIIREGFELRTENSVNGYYCVFCETFCNSIIFAERHIESPKHQRTKICDNLKGIDAKFAIKTDRITDTSIAFARRSELSKMSNVIKQDYYDKGIRLKDGIGTDAYICEKCGVSIPSLESIKNHLPLHKTLEGQLTVCTKPIIGVDFIQEYLNPNDLTVARAYECIMCKTITSSEDILDHLTSFVHRANFIKKVHPSEGEQYNTETPELAHKLCERSAHFESICGRGQWRVNHGVPPVIQFNKNLDSETKIPQKSETPKLNDERVKTELEMLLSAKVISEDDAESVVKVINQIKDAIFEYKMKKCPPQNRESFNRRMNFFNN